jgi:pectate lyase
MIGATLTAIFLFIPTPTPRHAPVYLPVLASVPAWMNPARTATPTATTIPVPTADEPVGYAGRWPGHAPVTGGVGGRVVVTGDAATMRAALAGPGRVTVYASGHHLLRDELLITNDKTLIGRGLRLTGEGVRIYQAGNVIVRNLTVADCREDAIAVRESQDVWLDGLDLSACKDGLVDITRGSRRVTVSNTRMHNHLKAMLIGEADHLEGGLSDQVTLWRVWMDGIAWRHPKLRYGRVHMSNVLITGWRGEAIDVAMGGQLYMEQSRFVATMNDERLAVRVVWLEGNGDPARISGKATLVGLQLPAGIKAESTSDIAPPPYGRSWVRPMTDETAAWIRDAGPEMQAK